MHTEQSFPCESRETQVALAPIQCLSEEAAGRLTNRVDKNVWGTNERGLAFSRAHLGGSLALASKPRNPTRVNMHLQPMGVTAEGGTAEDGRKEGVSSLSAAPF